MIILLTIAAIGVGCTENDEGTAETATIAPATPEPNVDVDNDPALTRTVDPGEDRSPYEGGPLGDDEVVGGDDPEPLSSPPPAAEDTSGSDEGTP